MNPFGREQVARLYELAEAKTERSRRGLFENISDLFISQDDRLTEHQRTLMTDILHKLLSDFEGAVRVELAAELSHATVPPELLRMLANDQIEIARPILEKSTLLRDADLIEIIQNRSEEHRLIIAMRARLSEKVSDALIEEGGTDVIEALLKNRDARISEEAMEYLVTESRRIDRFQEPLLSRNDLPSPLAHQMFWWVSAAMRRRILKDFQAFDHIVLDNALQDATRRVIAAHSQKNNIGERSRRLVAHLAEAGQLTVSFLMQSLRQQRVPLFVAGLAHLSDVSDFIVWRIFRDRGGESFAVLCRAINMSRNEFASLFLLIAEARGGPQIRPANVLKEILDLYDAISVANARVALTYWQRDSNYQQALDDIRNVGQQ